MAVTLDYITKKISKFSFIPKDFLYKITLGKTRKHSETFIIEKDLAEIVVFSNLSIVSFILSFMICYTIIQLNLFLSFALSGIIAASFFFVFGDYVRSKIIKRQQMFDEIAFLVINSLSINMKSSQSLPRSIELLLKKGVNDKFYKKYFEDMIFELNMGEDEDQIIEKNSDIFQNKRHKYAFQNLKNPDSFIETDPDFLIRIKREIKLIDDNIVIFVAVSCLLPLILSLVLALIVPPNSPTILLFPLLYTVFGTLTLRLIQNKSTSDKNV